LGSFESDILAEGSGDAGDAGDALRGGRGFWEGRIVEMEEQDAVEPWL
jgi:hypothetical protein